eukprot:s1720_g2.t4
MRLNASPSDPAWNTHKLIAHELKVPLQSLRVVLPDGQLLASACRANPGARLADVIETRKRRRAKSLDFSDAVADVGQLPPIVMQNPGWQIHLRRRSNVRHADKVPILWKRSMKHFIIAVSSAKAHRKIQPAFTMWQDHWPQGYL